MRVPRVFVPEWLVEGTGIDLRGEAVASISAACCASGRVPISCSSTARAVNGRPPSRWWIAERVSVRVGGHRPADRESPLHLTLAQGISRGERMDYTLQKAVELGVSRIVPIASERSVVRLSAERGERRAEHWARVVQAACEQCGRTRVPRLLPVATMDEWLSGVVPGLKLLLIRKEGACRLSELAPDPSITLLIGPEGGVRRGRGQRRRAGRVPSATARPAGPAYRDRGGRGLERPAGAVGRSRLVGPLAA